MCATAGHSTDRCGNRGPHPSGDTCGTLLLEGGAAGGLSVAPLFRGWCTRAGENGLLPAYLEWLEGYRKWVGVAPGHEAGRRGVGAPPLGCRPHLCQCVWIVVVKVEGRAVSSALRAANVVALSVERGRGSLAAALTGVCFSFLLPTRMVRGGSKLERGIARAMRPGVVRVQVRSRHVVTPNLRRRSRLLSARKERGVKRRDMVVSGLRGPALQKVGSTHGGRPAPPATSHGALGRSKGRRRLGWRYGVPSAVPCHESRVETGLCALSTQGGVPLDHTAGAAVEESDPRPLAHKVQCFGTRRFLVGILPGLVPVAESRHTPAAHPGGR